MTTQTNAVLPLCEIVISLGLVNRLSMAIRREHKADDKKCGLETHRVVGPMSCGLVLVVLTLAVTPTIDGDTVKIDSSR